jgi:hypothetical protein
MFSLTDAKSLIAKADGEASLMLLRYKMDQVAKFSGRGNVDPKQQRMPFIFFKCVYVYMYISKIRDLSKMLYSHAIYVHVDVYKNVLIDIDYIIILLIMSVYYIYTATCWITPNQ